MTNYKALLKKYMLHVQDREGTTLVDAIGSYSDSVKFTDEEVAVLETIDEGLFL